MNSLVDTYKHRYFDPRRGQVIGVNYGPSGQAIESELGLGSGKRIAGDALGLDVSALKKLVFRPGIDKVEIERGPYNPEKDPPVIEKLPYFPPRDDYGFELMLGGEIAHGGSTPYKPMDSDSLKKLTRPGSPIPPGMKEKILLELREMLRKA